MKRASNLNVIEIFTLFFHSWGVDIACIALILLGSALMSLLLIKILIIF